LFEQAQWAEDVKDTEAAERLYRRIMRLVPTDGAAAYNLGNLLQSTGRPTEAEAALRAAVTAEPDYAEAWFNLADLLDRAGRSGEAIACLRRALGADPTYADASFNLALLLQRRREFGEAIGCWRQYLARDHDSRWASRARRALKRCELELRLCGSQRVTTGVGPQDCPQLL
jgi:tetratricopeptide (TPR) repeat protein